jgi:hypothetical protein
MHREAKMSDNFKGDEEYLQALKKLVTAGNFVKRASLHIHRYLSSLSHDQFTQQYSPYFKLLSKPHVSIQFCFSHLLLRIEINECECRYLRRYSACIRMVITSLHLVWAVLILSEL